MVVSIIEAQDHANAPNAMAGPKRKPVRRDPEKRRLQNMQAQRKYREKMKQRIDRLDHLENLVASVAGKQQQHDQQQQQQQPQQPVDMLSVASQSITVPDQTSPGRGSSSTMSHQESPDDVNLQSNDDYLSPTSLELLSWTPPASYTSPAWDIMGSIDPNELLEVDDEILKPQWQLQYVDSGSLEVHDAANMALATRPHSCRLSLNPTALAADPLTNAIAFEELNLLNALFTICKYIGVTEQMFNDPCAMSPFYRPGGGSDPSSRESQEFVKSVKNIFKTIKPDLRPVEEQILYPHHPGIDVMPFPTFRRNLLTTKHEIDNEAGCHDMQTGLICWGTAGLSKTDRNHAAGRLSCGTPWDSRSWEAKPWFLRKYWELLGGDDGELVIQSEWWRRSRGDDSDIWSIT